MINTFSKFYYNYLITSTTKSFNFNEGAGQLTATIPTGSYTLTTLCDELAYQMEQVGTQNYTVTANRSTRVITISSAIAITILAATGTNAATGCYSVIGFNATDRTSNTSHIGNNITGSSYTPQYKLQNYVASEDNRTLRDQTVAKSASGKVEVISFGNDDMFEFKIMFANNIYQPSGSPITNSQTGVEDLRTLMQYLINKYEVEFMPDVNTPSTYYQVVLESTASGSNGTGYKLEEQYGRGLVGYFESGLLKFRVIEG